MDVTGDIIRAMSLDDARAWLFNVSAGIFGTEYVYDLETQEVTDACLLWLTRNKDYPKDLMRGIQIRGNKGSGKSHLMRCIHHMIPTKSSSSKMFVRCQTIVDDYVKNGETAMSRYNTVPILFLDDLGDEDEAKRYGQDRDVVGRLIESRAHHGVRTPMLTLSTTNNTKEQLLSRYKERVFDRMQQQACPFVMNRKESFRKTSPVPAWDWNTPTFNR